MLVRRIAVLAATLMVPALTGCAWHGASGAPVQSEVLGARALAISTLEALPPSLDMASIAQDSSIDEPMRVTATPGNILDATGSYGQPGWTMRRRFARTRTYVIDEGQIEFEQWYRYTHDRGEGPGHLWQTEIEFGLGNRMQFDMYVNTEHESPGPTKYVGLQPEFRYAFADWGQLPLNPTLYLEYKYNHGANDVAEAKILFSDDFSSCLHWGMNLSVEQEISGEREQELAITQAISWDVSPDFSVGAEFEIQRVTAAGSRDDAENAIYAGPSFQWRPTENTHIDLVPLFGFNDAHDHRIFLIFGSDFGAGNKVRHGVNPAGARSR